jgi:hypothetical protein
VLLLAVVVASGRDCLGLGFDFGNSEDGVGHRAVGNGSRAGGLAECLFYLGGAGGSAPSRTSCPAGITV